MVVVESPSAQDGCARPGRSRGPGLPRAQTPSGAPRMPPLPPGRWRPQTPAPDGREFSTRRHRRIPGGGKGTTVVRQCFVDQQDREYLAQPRYRLRKPVRHPSPRLQLSRSSFGPHREQSNRRRSISNVVSAPRIGRSRIAGRTRSCSRSTRRPHPLQTVKQLTIDTHRAYAITTATRTLSHGPWACNATEGVGRRRTAGGPPLCA